MGWTPRELSVPRDALNGGKVATDLGTGQGAASLVASPCTVLGVSVVNDNTGLTVYVHIFDKASTPVNGDVPLWVVTRLVNQGSLTAPTVPFTAGLYLANGLAIGLSTTRGTFTQITGANKGEYSVSVFYKN
jgi:hypothetical protein